MDVEIGNWFQPEGQPRFWWKACTEKFCRNYVCRGYSEDKCYVHMTDEQRARKELEPE